MKTVTRMSLLLSLVVASASFQIKGMHTTRPDSKGWIPSQKTCVKWTAVGVGVAATYWTWNHMKDVPKFNVSWKFLKDAFPFAKQAALSVLSGYGAKVVTDKTYSYLGSKWSKFYSTEKPLRTIPPTETE